MTGRRKGKGRLSGIGFRASGFGFFAGSECRDLMSEFGQSLQEKYDDATAGAAIRSIAGKKSCVSLHLVRCSYILDT